jgi:hypothetical protein
MTDTIPSQNIDVSSWITLYIYKQITRIWTSDITNQLRWKELDTNMVELPWGDVTKQSRPALY